MRLMLTAAVAAFIATPLAADHHAGDLAGVLAADLRDDDRARDQYRNPAETLEFFEVTPAMTVAEYGPGGGWYTRVLAPYLQGSGKYIAFDQDSDGRTYQNRAQEVRAKGWTERFKADVAAMTGVEADTVTAFEIDEMPEELLDRIVTGIEVAYYRAGTQILELGQQNYWLHYIRSGAVEIFRRSGELYNRIGEGEIFGQFGLMMNKKVRFPAKAIEDCLIYKIPDTTFQHLWETDENFADFVEIEDRSRLRSAVSRREKSNELMTAKVTRLISREPVSAPTTVRLQEAARIMTDNGVSALLLMDESGERPKLQGIITDRDLRTRAVTHALASETAPAATSSKPCSPCSTTTCTTCR